MPNSFEKVDSFIDSINNAKSIDEVFLELEKTVGSFGFDNFSYWLNWPPINEDRQLFIANYPEQFLEHYVKNNFKSDDVIGKYSAQTLVPFFWSGLKKKYKLTKDQGVVFDDGYSAGIKNGASLPIFGPNNSRATFSVSIDGKEIEAEKLFREYQHPLHLMATYVHEKIRTFDLELPSTKIILTARETEILTWAARGKTVWDIHQILNISENTVKTHLQHISYKLGVHNITHAVAKAILNGLISP